MIDPTSFDSPAACLDNADFLLLADIPLQPLHVRMRRAPSKMFFHADSAPMGPAVAANTGCRYIGPGNNCFIFGWTDQRPSFTLFQITVVNAIAVVVRTCFRLWTTSALRRVARRCCSSPADATSGICGWQRRGCMSLKSSPTRVPPHSITTVGSTIMQPPIGRATQACPIRPIIDSICAEPALGRFVRPPCCILTCRGSCLLSGIGVRACNATANTPNREIPTRNGHLLNNTRQHFEIFGSLIRRGGDVDSNPTLTRDAADDSNG